MRRWTLTDLAINTSYTEMAILIGPEALDAIRRNEPVQTIRALAMRHLGSDLAKDLDEAKGLAQSWRRGYELMSDSNRENFHKAERLATENAELQRRVTELEGLLGRSREMMGDLYCAAFERLDEDSRTTPTLFSEIDEALRRNKE